MLIYYKFNNFCSFYGENEFSMNAATGKVKRRFPDNYIETEAGYELLKSAVIVGENAGGKSNFINSLKYLKSLFVTNAHVKSVRSYINAESFNDTKQPIQRFEICFRANNGKVYMYELQIDESGIVLEKLQYIKKKKSKPMLVFECGTGKEEIWNINEAVLGDTERRIFRYYKSLVQKKELKLGLEISRQALLGNEDAIEVISWIIDTLYPEVLTMDTDDNIIKRDEDLKILKSKNFLDIFRMVDYSICGIEVDEEKPYSKSVVIRRDKEGRSFRRELQMDSAGVREFLVWAVYIFRVVYENKVVFADEMDRVLNPILSDRVISFINGAEHSGQFVFSTHNILHLDLKTYMKEQIYFVTKDRERLISEMYSLSDFPEVRYETTKIYEFYMKGILGGTAFE